MNRLFNPATRMHRSRPTAILLENIGYGILVLQPNTCHRDLLPCAETESNRIYQRYLGYPTEFLHDAHNVPEVENSQRTICFGGKAKST